MSVLESCKPRKEVLKGDLDDAIFAADFGDLVAGNAPAVYQKAQVFFQNTHPAEQLRKIVTTVFGRLADKKEGGATIRLSTGFGGGKTHALITLWHLAHYIQDLSMGTELLPAAGRPQSVTAVGIDSSKAGVPVFARHGNRVVRSLWGELAFQLGEAEALKKLGDSDDPEKHPDETLLGKLLPDGPVLILLDELVVYTASLSDRGQGTFLAVLNKLVAIISKRPQSILVITDPGEQAAYSRESAQLADHLERAAKKLDDVLGRRAATGFDPIGGEAARIISRRLFESVDSPAAQAASATYHDLYSRVHSELKGTIPADAASASYSQKIVECYPFHPRLIDTSQGRLGGIQEFNKSRGILRLFARVIRDVWEAKTDCQLITAGEIDWSSDRIQSDLLQRLRRDSFKAAIQSDIQKHAFDLDGGKRGVHVRAASALLLESIPLQSTSGMDPAELTLAILKPEEAGPEPGEALNRLIGVCWHTYPMPGGRGWQFRYEPNVVKQIEERMAKIPLEDAKSQVKSQAQSYFGGPAFKLSPWPDAPSQVPDDTELQLVLCETEAIAKSVCDYADTRDAQAPVPRKYQNAVFAVTAEPAAFSEAIERAQRLLAADAIERENRTGEAGKLVREQLQTIRPRLQKEFRIQTYRAFNRILLPGGGSYALDEQYMGSEEKMLQRPQGQASLDQFLTDKKLAYGTADTLDVQRFLDGVLAGATPCPDVSSCWTARAIRERFLAAPKLRLVRNSGIVAKTILKALAEGKIVVRTGDASAYDALGCVRGAAGNRMRTSDKLLTVSLDDQTLVARAESNPAKQWLKEDAQKPAAGPGHPGPGGGSKPPIQAQPITVKERAAIADHATARPLLALRIVASTPAGAQSLLALAVPVGADSLSLRVSTSGELKDGGSVSFLATGLKPAHPIKPIALAQTLFTAMDEGASFEAVLTLGFSPPGRTGLQNALQHLVQEAPDDLVLEADFGKPGGTGA
jgi:hypothetical protein